MDVWVVMRGAERDALLERMAKAGQDLAAHWGHPAWSDSWARLVAETMLEEVERG